jgi:large subunit ribosomal protein L15e
MGAYKYITEAFQREYKERSGGYKQRVIGWRKRPAIERVEKPTNLTRARRLGYKAKQGYAVVRVRVDKGRRTKRKPMGGRKPKSNYRFVQPGRSHQVMAEQRANRKYRNLEVLNSYWIGEDGNYKYFEVILADASKPSVNISSAIRQGKSFRGLTSAGQKGRGTKKKRPNKRLRRKKMIRRTTKRRAKKEAVKVKEKKAKPRREKRKRVTRKKPKKEKKTEANVEEKKE